MLMLARALATCSTPPRARAFYVPAHREAGARMWRDDWFPTLADSPAARHVHVTRGNGQEAVAFSRRNGSGTFRLVAASAPAIRSAATNLIVVDEGREVPPDVGDDLEAAAFPTLATGAGGQAWIVSSAGDGRSAWLARWRDLGRAAVDEDRRSGLCLVEYAAPDGADPDDEATWFAGHPGLVSGNVLVDAVRTDHDTMAPDVFAAEYLGWWAGTLVDARLVDAWAAAVTTWPTPTLGDPVTLAVELDEDRERAVIVAVGAHRAGAAVELVAAGPVGPWIVPRLVELTDAHNPVAVVWDAGGPAASLGPDLVDVATRLVPLGTRDTAAAAGRFHDDVLAGRVAHVVDVELDAAIDAARRRRAGGAWLFDRRQPGAGPLIAATLAAWVLADGRHQRPRAT